MDIAPRMQTALALLLQAHEYAAKLGCNDWQFAVEMNTFREIGLSKNDLRWLLLNEYVQHAWEVTTKELPRRAFQPRGGLLTEDSCFILTTAGVAVARLKETGASELCRRPASDAPTSISSTTEARRRPSWEKDRRALWFGACLVKQFKVPAANQELILAAFDEENWPVRLDDPLPFHASIDPRRRLHDTINSLNRNQRTPALRFFGDGTGQAICWEATEAVEAPDSTEASSMKKAVLPTCTSKRC